MAEGRAEVIPWLFIKERRLTDHGLIVFNAAAIGRKVTLRRSCVLPAPLSEEEQMIDFAIDVFYWPTRGPLPTSQQLVLPEDREILEQWRRMRTPGPNNS